MDSKSMFLSVTIWGAILSFLIPLITPKLQQLGIPVPDSATLAGKIVAFITFAITVYGRFRANSQPAVHVVAPSSS